MIHCFTVLLLALVVTFVDGACHRVDWWKAFDKEGHVKCHDWGYVTGFYRNDPKGPEDYLYLLEEAECCHRPSPWRTSRSLIVYADWTTIFDGHYKWANCPDGYYLDGFYRSGTEPGWLHHIEEGRCARPDDHPPYHGECYHEDISRCFDIKGLCKCNPGYFVTGIYKSGCDKLYCLETLKCCKMKDAPIVLDEKYKVQTRIMETTLRELALLAHYLGYGWCGGCRSLWVGEDFRRRGTTWYADKSGRCTGFKNDHRLSIDFGHWSFELKDLTFGTPVIKSLTAETVDGGPVYNNDSSPLTHTVKRTERIVRSVTHSITSAWKNSHELGIQITYKPPSPTGGVGGNLGYTFRYEHGTTTQDISGNSQNKEFTVESTKTIPAFSATRWEISISKTMRSVTYEATVIPKFSTTFLGFLRWGGGYDGPSTNYHYLMRGSGDRPTFNYRFGDADVPFYTAVKRLSDANSLPWMWNDMKLKYPYAEHLINGLAGENRYQFHLTGRIDDVEGEHVEVRWDPIISGPILASTKRGGPRTSTDNQRGTHVAMAGVGDLPFAHLDPPSTVKAKPQMYPELPTVLSEA